MKPLARTRRFLAWIVVIVLVIIGYVGGCTSHELPAPLSAVETIAIEQTHFDLSVGVERPIRSDRWDAEAPLAALQATKLFKAVDYLDRLSTPPDLIARGSIRIDGTPTIPFLTILTLGVFPTWVQEKWGFTFSFRSPIFERGELEITVRHQGTTVLGWECVYLNMLPNWSQKAPIMHPRLYDQVAREIVSKSAELIRLAKR